MKEINIPPIYEEDIIGFIYNGIKIQFKYNCEDSIIVLEFDGVYLFDFCDFDYLSDTEWQFGLVEYNKSSLLQKLMSRIPSERVQRAFGGDLEKISHYKLVIDDVGIYNIVCKNFAIIQE